MQKSFTPSLVTAAILLVTVSQVGASCGAAVCALNTHWRSRGVWTEPGWRADLRFEYIDQDQPRAGSRTVGVGEIPAHHDEVRTLNHNWIAGLDYTLNANWGVSIVLPFVDREHWHIHNHHGVPIPEAWNFTAPGDARILGRYQWTQHTDVAHGLSFGLKLPTGSTDERNSDGDLAERSLQPGTGTTDVVLGYYSSYAFGLGGEQAAGFVQLQVQVPLDEHDNYKPGTQYALDSGLSYPLSHSWSAQLQANLLVREKEAGTEAEPEKTGGTFFWLSPGLSVAVNDAVQAYGFVQLPIYQYVNGVQLTADYALALGTSWRF